MHFNNCNLPVSVLLPIYARDNPIHLHLALKSVFQDQIKRPLEIIIIQDGCINDELTGVVDYFKTIAGNCVNHLIIEKNLGLASALNYGLKFVKYPFVARMDADDISLPLRFQLQYEFLINNPNVDLVGCQLSEIDNIGSVIKEKVSYPLTNSEMLNMFKYRDPLAHPTVMFRMRFFELAGQYSKYAYMYEDTYLWYKGFKSGCVFANIPQVALLYRRTNDFYIRRKSLRKALLLFKCRIFTINKNLKFGFLSNLFAFAYFMLAIFPPFVLKYAYRFLR